MTRARRIIDAVVSLAILAAMAGGLYYFRQPLSDLGRRGLAEVLPCTVPIRYDLDRFDDQFGVSRQEFLEAVGRAGQKWSEAAGKTLFTYQPGGELKVNLIYDYRQQATDRLKELGLWFESHQDSYDKLKAKYLEMKAALDSQKVAYRQKLADHDSRVKTYEAEVESWNAKGGAPKGVYEKLEAERLALNREASQLNDDSQRLNQAVDNFNAVVTVLNRMADDLNLEADEFNQTATVRGEKFQEGEYVRENGDTRINIYEFTDATVLERVLIHELGHALGLEHISDRTAVMYELNTGTAAELSESDRQAVRDRCGLK